MSLSRWVWLERVQSVAWAGVLLRVWSLVVWAVVTVLFVYQASLNFKVYQAVPTVLTVSLEPNPNFRLPPVTVCPFPAFDPVKLRNLGLNVSGNVYQFEESYLNLRGVPEDLIVSQLWQDASWEFNQVVHFIHTSNEGMRLVEPTESMPPRWQRSISPLGPCYTYNPPIGNKFITLFFQNMPILKPCQFINKDGKLERYKGLEKQCEQVETLCNSSCGMENYIYLGMMNFDLMYVYFHESPVYSKQPPEEEDILSYSQKLFDGNYILNQLTHSPNLLVTTHFIESSLIKGSCNSNPAYTHGQCYNQMHTAMALQKVGCPLIQHSNFHQPSGQVCRSPEAFRKLYPMEHLSKFRCPQKCKRRWFSHDMKLNYEMEFAVTLTFSTTDLKREVEVESYPMAQFFSDTGGSLGLFLGVSILTFLDLVVVSVARFFKTPNEERKKLVVLMVRYCIILLLAIGTGAHSLETLRTFLFQPRLTAVSLRVATPELANDTILITHRLAARALDCRPQETVIEECRARCLLEQAANDLISVSPFIRLEDLPLCSDAGLSLPSPAYVVPPEMLLMATQGEKVDICHKQCGQESSNNNSQAHGFVMVVNNNHYNFDILQLACSIGGVIGLYLGYSMFDGLDLSYSILSVQERLVWPKLQIHRVYYTLKIVIVTLSVVLALWQLHTFLLYHKVSSSSTKVYRENRTEQLAIIMCRWPPLSLSHVATELGLNISIRLLYKLPKEKRLLEVLRVLDTLPGNWSITLDEIWERAAWNITDVVEGFLAITKDGKYNTFFCASNPFCAELWRPIITPLNRCFSFNASLGGSDVEEMTILFPELLEKKGILGNSPQIYFTVTPVNEQPLLLDMVAKTAYHRILVTPHQAKYQRLGSSSGVNSSNYRSCVHHCLSETVFKSFKCRLPYVLRQPKLLPCDQENYSAMPKYYKGLEGIGRIWTDLSKSDTFPHSLTEKHDKCYQDCRHLQHTFTTISIDRAIDTYPSVVVRMHQEEDVLVQEEDHHTSSQLFSDMGGIAGSTAGFSLSFLLKDILPSLLARRNE